MPYYPTPDSLENGDLISCHIARKTAENGNFDEAFRNLPKLIENSQLVRKFQDKMIIHISGYDDDPRPLWEIPDARRALQALDRSFPVWLHFCEKEKDSVQLMVLCLTPLTTVSTNVSMFAASPQEFVETVNERVKAAHILQMDNGFNKDERDRFAQTVADYLLQMTKRFFRPRNDG